MRHSLVLFFSIIALSTHAQPGYKIDFKVTDWKDTTVYLGHYIGEQTYLKDTARANTQGAFTFDNANNLQQGVYFLVLNKSKIFDFVSTTTEHRLCSAIEQHNHSDTKRTQRIVPS